MSRHPILVPLSQEHERLLLVCHYLKKDATPPEGFPVGTSAKLAYIVKVFQEIMVPHIQKEEYLFERCQGMHAGIDALMEELKLEHQQISRMYSALTDTKEMPELLDQLARSLEEHILKEEAIFFEQLQQELCAELDKISW